MRRIISVSMTKILTTTLVGLLITSMVLSSSGWAYSPSDPGYDTKTPIKHVVVIFQENVSYDHYFGTYPNAPGFVAKPHTPTSDNYIAHPSLLTSNPNLYNPFLLRNAVTCDQDHEYLDEQKAVNGSLMNGFVQHTEGSSTTQFCVPGVVMGYYDGQNATAQWNLAQNFAMSDRSFDTTFGPSTPGAINLISGQTFGASEDAVGGGAAISDTDPLYDDCHSSTENYIQMSGKNIGDILNDKGITWGWFQGGFAPSTPYSPGHPAVCGTKTTTLLTGKQTAYSSHHEPFEYYNSTANPHHLPPTSISMIGQTDQANHQYDLSNFWKAVNAGSLPQVTFLKAPKGEDGHASYSDPVDEGQFLANVTNTIQKSTYWPDTAVFVLWDDSDGWYDHVVPPIVNHSNDPLNDYAPTCGKDSHEHNLGLGTADDRCGYGQRLPFLVISPYAKSNYISHTTIDQTSPLKFIEDNWHTGGIPDTLGQRSYDQIAGSVEDMFDFSNHGNTPQVCISPTTGQVVTPFSACPNVELSGY